MKKIVLALIVVAILLLVEPLAQVDVGADVPQTFARVYSPNPAPYIYVNSTVEIVIDYIVPIDWAEIKSFNYSVDDGQDRYIIHSHTSNESGLMYYHMNGTMEFLADGNHTYRIYAFFDSFPESRLIYEATFTVDKNYQPTPSPIATPTPTPTVKNASFEFEPTVFGILTVMVIATVIALFALLYLEKH